MDIENVLKLLSIYLLFGFTIWGCRQQSSAQQPIQIRSNFDHGSMGVLKQTEPGVFRGQTNHFIKKNQNGDQYYWFYFQILNAKDKFITVNLNHMVGIYRGRPHLVYTDYTQPVISTDKKSWQRITDVDYSPEKMEFVFSFTPSGDTAWVAYAQPYPYSRYQGLIESLRDRNQVNINKIGESVLGRPINMIEIAEKDNTISKKNVFITGMQHAGEDAGGFFIDGLIRFLLSGNARAESVLRKCNFYIIPMMNPDGFFYGTTRYNWNMEDLNSEWDDGWTDTTDVKIEREVMAVQKWTKNFLRQDSIDLFIDIHNQSQKNRENTFFYSRKRIEKFVNMNTKIWDVVGNNGGFNASIVWYMGKKYNISAATLELTQSHTGSGNYLTIQDYYEYGSGLGKAIDQYFP